MEIVKYYIEHEMDYAQTAEKFQVSYQQIHQWTRKYQSNGVEGLVDRREKRKTESEMSGLEKLRAENRLLQAEKRKARVSCGKQDVGTAPARQRQSGKSQAVP